MWAEGIGILIRTTWPIPTSLSIFDPQINMTISHVIATLALHENHVKNIIKVSLYEVVNVRHGDYK